ncbi:polysaccharide pyruvyl transferase WcaK-like protein [Rhizomicrobium palustre]|uniref:Polysaccharide pyruvyl transferase WcaK-like protein n=1 Tax=Rhizomicrobium palustre TaxID=189966 RepID=A0A846MZC9_9PROT|nr:polysaccharide pyruvyl transferase family protein [Rhizomicrobium palustre]NIK88362.1 polysaccharide pyruvyl transferase WcaK-like protein [Rhizomicrobium palustre]
MTSHPKVIYFAGQWSFGNRGCEALIRSNTKLLRERFADIQLICPSTDIELDRKQWPNAVSQGITFVPAPKVPLRLKLWNRAYTRMPNVHRLGMPPVGVDPETSRQLAGADALIMTGGDIISLDYDLLSLYYWVGVVEAARKLGKPTHLVAASVGPFTKRPAVERQMTRHLAGYTSITVRETASFGYLKGLGLTNVQLVADPAFVMDSEPWDTSAVLVPERSYLGINFSPLVRGYRPTEDLRRAFDREIVEFFHWVLAETAMDIMLVPHVWPLAGVDNNSDWHYLQGLMNMAGDTSGRIRLLPDGLNTAQLKYALGLCRYFIGARTHGTIGAISQSVPTLSIAYSIKAIGINNDLFGSTDYVLPTPDVTRQSLSAGLQRLIVDESAIKTLLAAKLPEWKSRARKIPDVFVTSGSAC